MPRHMWNKVGFTPASFHILRYELKSYKRAFKRSNSLLLHCQAKKIVTDKISPKRLKL